MAYITPLTVKKLTEKQYFTFIVYLIFNLLTVSQLEVNEGKLWLYMPFFIAFTEKMFNFVGMERKHRRIIVEGVEIQFMNIFKAAQKVCLDYDTKIVPLNLAGDLIDIGRMQVKTGMDSFSLTLVANNNNILDKLYEVLATQSKRMGGKGVTLDFLKLCILTIIKNFKEGLKKG